jgi:hypothetical protein
VTPAPLNRSLCDATACHSGVRLHCRSISRFIHPGTVGSVQRYVAHAHEDFAVARLGHRAFDEAEMLESELARRLLCQSGYLDRKLRSAICKPCSRCAMVDRAEPGGAQQYAANHTSLLRFHPTGRNSTDWNWPSGHDWRCRSRHTRGPSSLHARCDAALFRFPFGRIANDEMHDGQAGTMESGMPRRDGAPDLPPCLSALQILHARPLPLINHGNCRRPSMTWVGDCRPAYASERASSGLIEHAEVPLRIICLMGKCGASFPIFCAPQRY